MATNLKTIAASLASPTKTAAKAALKAAGLKQTLADDVLAIHGEIANLRKRAEVARIERRIGHELPWDWRSQAFSRQVIAGRKPVLLPQGTPAARLEVLRKSAVRIAFRENYRVATHGSRDVVLTTDPAQVGTRQDERDDWNVYAKSYKHGPARVQDTAITAPADWRIRVQRRGLEVIDGMMTLDAAPLEGAPEGVELFAAKWIVQGRGTSVWTMRGYIARCDEHTYHGESAQKALAGLKRKLAAAEWAATLQTADLSALVAKARGALVRVADARAIGACEYGIKSWCNSVGIDYETGHAPIAEVYAAYQQEPRPEARAAILHALRRQRSALAA